MAQAAMRMTARALITGVMRSPPKAPRSKRTRAPAASRSSGATMRTATSVMMRSRSWRDRREFAGRREGGIVVADELVDGSRRHVHDRGGIEAEENRKERKRHE